MTDTKALDALIEAVEEGAATMGDFARAFPSETAYGKTTWGTAHNAFSGSLDAAKALHEALLPGWGWETGVNTTFVSIASVWKSGRERAHSATADDPARAWLLAVIKAYRAGL